MFSDLNYAKVSGFKMYLLLVFFLLIAILLYAYLCIFHTAIVPMSYLQHFWAIGHYLWIASVPFTFLGLMGMLFYRKENLEYVKSVDNLVSFRIVSYGKNVEALRGSINHITHLMEMKPLFEYVIEVLVEEGQPFCDIKDEFSDDTRVEVFIVPQRFKTPKETKKKARALQYAVLESKIPDDSWIVHLDEESRPSKSMILGIAKAIQEEEKSGSHRIGQGAIVYYRHWSQKKFLWWTMLDSGRTGQDLGPFYLQSLLGISLYGFHGSWILIRNSVEKNIPGQFDLGPKGSITEDAWWCLIANANGHKIRWVEGYLEEQSVRSFRDFCKQRGRWFYGLTLVSKNAPVSFWRRLPIRLNLLLWMFIWLSFPYSMIHLFFGFSLNPLLFFLIAISISTYAITLVTGMWVNLNLFGLKSKFLYIIFTIIQLLLVPVYALLEIFAALFYGYLFPEKDDFYVIKK